MRTASAETQPPEELFRENLPLIERVIASVCRRRGLGEDEAEELASTVRLKLVEDDYRVLRRFEGKSSLGTYLTMVVQRMFLDFLRARRGRKRPSAEARRLGAVAIQLERLLYWDGFGFDEACRILRENHGVRVPWQELEEMAGRLRRPTEHREEGGETVDHLAGAVERPDAALAERQSREEAERVVGVLEEALAALDAEDRLILRMRFEEGLTVADVARALHLPQKPLYRRIARLLRTLRREMEARGLRSPEGWWC
jgi:RNA polymerase sigma factor for flagellar operon FliA